MLILTLFYLTLALIGLYLLSSHRNKSRKYSRLDMLRQFHQFEPPSDWVSVDRCQKQATEKIPDQLKDLNKTQKPLPEDKENFSPEAEVFVYTCTKQLNPMVPDFVPTSLNPEAPAFSPLTD